MRRIRDGIEVYGIVHWGLNTYTDREWGFGDENPADLNPDRFDADQIVGACKAGGLKGLVVVAKHHDGFCLWPTKTTGHNISKSPFRGGRGDYVREMEQACRKAGLRFGVYVSPWDRNSIHYATEKYVDIYHAQIKELLSGDYGEVFEMWFDGANGGDGWYGGAAGPKGERRKIGAGYYRFPEVFRFVRELQPDVCIFSGENDASDYRWPGNERGVLDPDSRATIETVGGFSTHGAGYGNPNYKGMINTGAAHGEFFRMCEADFPLRPGWFYHAAEDGKTKSAAYLTRLYLSTVGNGGTMNIGVAPNKSGVLADEDVRALRGFGDLRQALFARPVTEPGAPFNVVLLREDLSRGEQVDGWELRADGRTVLSGKSIGNKRICVLPKMCAAKRVEVVVTKDGGELQAVTMELFLADPSLVETVTNATTESGETDTAKWMTGVNAGVRSAVRADGPWEMAQAAAPEKWMPAVVPGTVLTTLVKNGVVPDPYWGLNNKLEEKRIPDLVENRAFYEATFRTKVVLPSEWTKRVIWMRPEGINYRSEIYLNGKLATSTRGMFARNAVDVSPFVKAGAANELVVRVWPVDHPGTTMPKSWGAANGEWHNGGDGEIGRDVTMLMSAGWDFTFSDGIRDRNTGVWKDIVFFATDAVRLDHPYVRTKLNADFSEAELTLEVDLQNASSEWNGEAKGTVVAEVEGTDVRFEKAVSLFRGERRTEFLKATMKRPKLWWPRNKGRQDLYALNVRFVGGKTGKVSDEKRIRFGVRELTSDQGGKDGARQFYCNRRKIFIRGTNWIPEAMLKSDDVRMEREMRLTAESGVNLVRLWAGGIVESDRFYELCDEYGLLVWQEFWMTGDTRHPDDPGLYLDNVAQQVKRIRHHASLAHWVASNESTEVAGTEELVKKLTGTTSWMMQSECDGVHDGSPYFPVNPMSYYEDTASPRGSRVYGFSPEYGTCALPAADQCRKFMPEELLWPMNVAAWKYREGGGFDQLTLFHHQAVNGYGESKTFDEYARKAQAADALAHRALWEAWNLARNEATGVLFWYNNTPIPQLGSHAWDYDLDQTASFFAQKNALEPLHAQYEYLSNRVSVVSDVYGTRDLTVRAEVYDFESRKVWEKEEKVKVEGEGCVEMFAIPFDATGASRLRSLTKPHFIKLRLFESGKEIASTFYWRSASEYKGANTVTGPCVAAFEKLNNLPKTTLRVERTATGVAVTNTGDKLAFFVRVKAMKGGKLVVPVHYSDNYLNLLPGEASDVAVEGLPPDAELVVSAWNVD